MAQEKVTNPGMNTMKQVLCVGHVIKVGGEDIPTIVLAVPKPREGVGYHRYGVDENMAKEVAKHLYKKVTISLEIGEE